MIKLNVYYQKRFNKVPYNIFYFKDNLYGPILLKDDSLPKKVKEYILYYLTGVFEYNNYKEWEWETKNIV